MCGRRHQRRACGGYGYGATSRSGQAYTSTAGVPGVIAAFQQMRFGGGGGPAAAGLPYNQTQQRSIIETGGQQQINGVIHTPTPAVRGDNEKTAEQTTGYEVLPTYNEIVGSEDVGARNFPLDDKQAMEAARSFEDYRVPQTSQAGNEGVSGVLAAGLTQFQSALASYSNGTCGGRREAKRAAKNLVYEMYAAEMARRRAQEGRLECGERKQIKRDLKPVKQMLKNAVWEAKRARPGCC